LASYLFQASYTPEAWAAQTRNPQDQIEAMRGVVENLGGKVTAGFISFGEYDVMVIADLPSNSSAAALSIAAAGTGAMKAIKTTPLLSADEAMDAMRSAAASGYAPPIGMSEESEIME
jgi:uncharacterized protein with GYD domain